MRKQETIKFSKGADDNTYVSDEVDSYIGMIHVAYEEMGGELNALNTEYVKDKGIFEKEKERLEKLLNEEREERFNIDAKNEQLEKSCEDQKEKYKNTLAKEQEANQILKDEKEQIQQELIQAKKTIEELEKSFGEIPNLENMKKFYESQIKTLKDKLSSEREANVELEGEKLKLKENIKEHLKVIKELKKINADAKNISEIEKLCEEKVSGLEELVARLQEEIHALQTEKATIGEAKKRLEEEQFNNTSDGRAKAYGDLFERSADTAQRYVDETKAKMDAMLNEAQEKHDTLLDQAQVRAFNVVRDARIKSDELIEQATKDGRDLLNGAKDEYDKIRGLIKKASKEYVVCNNNFEK